MLLVVVETLLMETETLLGKNETLLVEAESLLMDSFESASVIKAMSVILLPDEDGLMFVAGAKGLMLVALLRFDEEELASD